MYEGILRAFARVIESQELEIERLEARVDDLLESNTETLEQLREVRRELVEHGGVVCVDDVEDFVGAEDIDGIDDEELLSDEEQPIAIRVFFNGEALHVASVDVPDEDLRAA